MTTETVLTDAAKEAVDEAIATALGDAYDCTRTWSAWSYGTMGPEDFSLVAEDSDRLREITDAAIQAVLQSSEVQRLREDAERYRWLRDRNLSDDTETEPWISAAKNDDERWGLSGDIADSRIDAAMEKQP